MSVQHTTESPSSLTAAILVGGLGTRLRAVVGDRQKVIAPVAGRPFLYRLLDQLADAGLRRVILCTGYKAEDVQATIGAAYRSLSITYSRETTPLGTAGALRRALPLLDSDPLLVLNGDSYCPADLAAFLIGHRRRGAAASLVVSAVEDTAEGGRVVFGPNERITSFREKVPGQGWVSAGIYLLSRSLLESIPCDRAVSIERESFPGWLDRGIWAFPTQAKVLDIGTPARYAAAANSL